MEFVTYMANIQYQVLPSFIFFYNLNVIPNL